MAGQASNSFGDEEGIITGINVTPLVDITLVLLIIFMVTASSIVGQSIDVDLPRAASGAETEASTVSLVLSANGETYLNGSLSPREEILKTIEAQVKENPELQVIVAADASSSHGQVIGLIDAIKLAGVTRFAISTEPVEPRAAETAALNDLPSTTKPEGATPRPARKG